MSLSQCTWSDVAQDWDRWRDRIEEGDSGITAALLDAAAPLAGSRVLELAAGTGEVAARIADAVGPDGSVVASDEAEGMVALLTGRLAGLDNVEVRRIDARRIASPDDAYDAVVCRMGLMLVADPTEAATEARRVLRPVGRLAAAVWADPSVNPWLASVGMAAMMHGLVAGGPPTGPGGPFSLADPEAVRALLEDAGFTDVRVDAVDGVRHYDGVEEHLDMGGSLAPPLSAALAAAAPETVTAVRETLRQLTSAYLTDDGGLDLPLRALVASATA
jgi:SAM-dependent methyltransferase